MTKTIIKKPTNSNALQNALLKERMFGLPTNRTATNFKPFKGFYISVEEVSGNYKPIVCKEYDKNVDLDSPPWPIIHYTNHSSYTIFAPAAADSDGRESAYSSEDIESQIHPIRDSNASGLISGSTASVMNRQIKDNPQLATIAQRVGQLKRPTESEISRPTKKYKKNVFPIQKDKPGYCENCNQRYDDYQDVSKYIN
jgi:hypothetical protein